MNLLRSFKKRAHKMRSLIVDPDNLKLTEAMLKQRSQLDKTRPFLVDRREEVKQYYKLNDETVDKLMADELAHSHHHHHDDDEEDDHDHHHHEELTINPEFDSDENLFNYYRNHDLHSAVSHMCFDLPYYRYSHKLLQYINSYYPRNKRQNITVMDYGCGSADYSLAFAGEGYHIRIVDLLGGPIGFAQWRLEQRNYPHDAIAVSEDNLYPNLGKNDIVLAPEVLEHIRNPVKLLENMFNSMPSGGFFWTSGFPVVEREVGADHLPEAAAARLDALAYIKANAKQLTLPPLPGFLFRKK